MRTWSRKKVKVSVSATVLVETEGGHGPDAPLTDERLDGISNSILHDIKRSGLMFETITVESVE